MVLPSTVEGRNWGESEKNIRFWVCVGFEMPIGLPRGHAKAAVGYTSVDLKSDVERLKI